MTLTRPLLRDTILSLRTHYMRDYALDDIAAINAGLCADFAEDVLTQAVGTGWVHREGNEGWTTLESAQLYKPLPGMDTTEGATQWDWALLATHWGVHLSLDDQAALDAIVIQDPSHCWIALDGQHFDCEHPEGVPSPFHLSFFQRWLSL